MQAAGLASIFARTRRNPPSAVFLRGRTEILAEALLNFSKNREASQYEASVEGAPVVRHLIQAGRQFFPTDNFQAIRL
jgi:hypothetical protein